MQAKASEIDRAFRLLGVSPDASPAAIRAAWKALVRTYHPDQFGQDKSAANRRLAELNAAFDLVSSWTPQDAAVHRRAAAERRATQKARGQTEARHRRAAEARHQKAAAREAAEANARRRAADLDRAEAAKRAARARRRAATHRVNPTSPAEMFRAALAAVRTAPRPLHATYA